MSTETVRLYGWTTFEDGQTPIRSLLFGEMVRRATPLMEMYQSDLFHDALWLQSQLVGEQSFDWLIRPCGTNLSAEIPTLNSAYIGVNIGPGDGAVFYRVHVYCDRDGRAEGMWYADFTQVPLQVVRDGYTAAAREIAACS